MNPSAMLTRLFRQRRDWLPMLLALLACFALMWPLQLFTPMHSDDYAYTHKGITWAATWKHYTSWSGRLVADFLSSAVLILRNHAFSATFNTLAFVALMFVLWWLPRFDSSRPMPSSSVSGSTYSTPSRPWRAVQTFALLFMLYWLGNPALGEINFWIVGSANYVWTNVLHMLFLGLFLREALEAPEPTTTQQLNSRWPARSTLTLLLAPIAGCTNENTSISTLMLMGLICLHVLIVRNEWHWRTFNWKLPAYGLAFTLGTAALIFAPGNAVRKQIFIKWNKLGWEDRALVHFTERAPLALHHLGLVLLTALVLLFVVQKARAQEPNKQNALAWLFMLAAVFSLAIMVASPILPQRSLAGTLMYLLLAISCVLVWWEKNGSEHEGGITRRVQSALNAFTAALALVFALSYGLMQRAYHQIAQQNEVRQQIIHEGMARRDALIYIPTFHWLPLLRGEAEHFTEFFNDEMVSWVEGTHSYIQQFEVTGPYSTEAEARAMLSPEQLSMQKTRQEAAQAVVKRPR